MDSWIRGFVDSWTRGFVDSWRIRGFVGWVADGLAGGWKGRVLFGIQRLVVECWYSNVVVHVLVLKCEVLSVLPTEPMYLEWCREHKITQPVKKWYEAAIKKQGAAWPRMTQTSMKGAQIRTIIYWLEEVCGEDEWTDTEYGQWRYLLLGSLVAWDLVCRRNGRFLPTEEAEELASLTEKILSYFNALAEHCVKLGKKLWKFLPKMHMFTHMGYDQAKKANPRRVHCYSDEDLVGKMKLICRRCHPMSLQVRSVERYVIMISIRWWKHLAVLRGLEPGEEH